MNRSLAAERLERARSLASPCRLCPRRCGARRERGERGWCGAGAEAFVFLDYVHWGEAEELCPTHAVYLAGCNQACRFCSTAAEALSLPARPLTPAALDDIVRRGKAAGARSMNLLGGEPLVHMPALLAALTDVDIDPPPVVWKTNLYAEAETVTLLSGVADVVMGDLKFGNDDCAARLGAGPDGVAVPRARAAEIFALTPEALVVRHLAVPGHFDCCTRPVLEWIALALPGVRVDVRTDYMPPSSCRDDAALGRLLRIEEARAVEALAGNLGLRRIVPAHAPTTAGGAAGEEGVTVEAAISPEGVVYLRHSIHRAAAAAQAAGRNDNA